MGLCARSTGIENSAQRAQRSHGGAQRRAILRDPLCSLRDLCVTSVISVLISYGVETFTYSSAVSQRICSSAESFLMSSKEMLITS